jgi:pimeloyl-ACP methyl ester carboxylesterase
MIEKFSLDHVEIEAIVNGSGEVIILLAGLGGEASTFDEFTPYLNNASYKTVAIDLRGIAGSKGPLDNLTLHDLASDVAGVIKLLGGTPVHVIGWAFGNRIARCLAEDHPHLVKSVTLLAAGGKIPPDPEALKNMWKFFNPKLSKKERIKSAQLSLFSPSTDSESIFKGISSGRSWPNAITAHSKANQATPIKDWWNGGQAPMLVVQGLDDLIALPENGEILKREHDERVTLINIENAGHSIVHEKPKRVAEEIISFYSKF